MDNWSFILFYFFFLGGWIFCVFFVLFCFVSFLAGNIRQYPSRILYIIYTRFSSKRRAREKEEEAQNERQRETRRQSISFNCPIFA